MLRIAYHPIYKHPLPEGHRFPMEKYELLPKQLLHEGTCTEANFYEPGFPDEKYITAVHTPEYVTNLKTLNSERRAARKIGFPLSQELVDREQIIAQGTILGCHYALENGISFNIAGGTHHAYSDHGEAFCLFNDQAIGARYLQSKGLAQQVLIVDLDVHQGNGTAEIFQGDDSVFTFSIHGAGNYPFKKEVSDLDIAIPDNSGDAYYLGKLKETLPRLIDQVKPNFIFYLSGVDILETDKLGRLSCSVGGCKERDRFALSCFRESKIPVQVSMGGGYSPDIKIIIEAHANTYRLAQEIYF
ncbi:acetoin utilization deacetylase AcuC-like enzyme [Leeuwenhoekiella aestuarii]|uniref:Acetoin utilization deacetylase AcuC-like enzyme n=1 Tax=Leeuwenhoekiella aestuarii TaxID=2249426 RepID=A0A4Q0NT60_9FLAO|nr:histone deacetylase [Leeuwenhoekiella aestuarii]RXG14335.1 acetoin utilization deacetylase AcuC-like enzyme [Leeuwenhoekiella aestuarii]RXG19084.1 acetoin utilization deacetylase AcuC-like enzyme [Leeuwenhoekiella aestuarii]